MARLHTLLAASASFVASTLAIASPAAAVTRPGARSPTPTATADLDDLADLVAMPGAGLGPGRGVRSQPRFTMRAAEVGAAAVTAWARFVATRGGGWRASWDRGTGVASRIWGPGIAAPGAMASPAIAEAAARAALAAHLDVLAPGSAASDFVLVSNVSDGDQRSIGFEQTHGGVRVLGAQVSFRFKADRLFVMSSQAAPHVAVAWPTARLAQGDHRTALTRAFGALGAQVLTATPATASTLTDATADLAILPLVGDAGMLGYRVVTEQRATIAGRGEFAVWVDPATGAPIARRALRSYGSGELRASVVDRNPSRTRLTLPLPRASVELDGQSVSTSATGEVSWAGGGGVTASVRAAGALAEVSNQAGDDTVATIALTNGGTATWHPGDDTLVDAQVSAYVHTNVVKEYIRTFAPDLPELDDALTINVNINDACNAYYTNSTTNFFLASDGCQNTGVLADVVYHETGHWLHDMGIIPGVGRFDGAMSEGLSDFLAASITGDSGMGRGFFYDDEPLRELDELDDEARWPDDVGEIHQTGIIFGGVFWDLRKALIEAHGEAEGVALVNRLFFAAVQRATDIPSSLIEALAADDDNGDLSDGTPNECLIRAAFGAHGLRLSVGQIDAPGVLAAVPDQATTPVRIDVRDRALGCPGDAVTRVTVRWVPGSGMGPSSGDAEATQVGVAPDDYWTVQLPLPDDYGYVNYRGEVTFADGGTMAFPDNPASPSYQLSRGEFVPLYCTSFDDDPFADHWTQLGDDWAWGAGGDGATTDPPGAYSGDAFLALAPSGDYEADHTTWAALPRLDVGAFSDVRLQYRRWLAVEDGFFDQAAITVNGVVAWSNLNSDNGDSSSVHHLDREWRHHEVRLSTQSPGPLMDVRFELTSDGGLEFGGWNVDDLCVVANPESICGDGVKSRTEQCDDGAGNGDAPDACRRNCTSATCGDGVVDSDEECDPGATPDYCTPGCNQRGVNGGADVGCSAGAGGASAAPLALTLLGLAAMRRRRRR
jgi:MYXO-CTERM domain-containing protein